MRTNGWGRRRPGRGLLRRPGLRTPRHRPPLRRRPPDRRSPVCDRGGGVPARCWSGQCDSLQVLSEVKLAIAAALDQLPQADADLQVTVLERLGLGDELVTTLAWEDLDRAVRPDHLTSLWIPALGLPFRAGTSAPRRTGPGAAGALPVGPPANPPEPDALPAGGVLRGCSKPSRSWAPTAPATSTWKKSSGTSCSRWCSTPCWRPSRASSPWATSPAMSTTNWSPATPTCSATSRPRLPRTFRGTGSR